MLAALLPSLLMTGCGDPIVAEDYLAVINVSPSHGSANIGLDTTLRAVFNEAIDEDSLDGAVWLEDADGAVVPTALDYYAAGNTVILTPSDLLEPDTEYDIVLSEGLAGQEYGGLASEVRSAFTTVTTSTGDGSDANEPPVALLFPFMDGCFAGSPFTIVGDESYDPEGAELVDWRWRLAYGDGSLNTFDDPTLAVLNPDSGGQFTVGLIVSDGELDSSEGFISVTCN